MTTPEAANEIASGAAALIDGFYLRYGQKAGAPPRDLARRLVEQYIDDALAARQRDAGIAD